MFPLPISIGTLSLLCVIAYILMYVMHQFGGRLYTATSGINSKLNILKVVLIIVFVWILW